MVPVAENAVLQNVRVTDRTEEAPFAKVKMFDRCKTEVFLRKDIYSYILDQIWEAASPETSVSQHKETGGVLVGRFLSLADGAYQVNVEGVIPMNAGTLAEFSITQNQMLEVKGIMRERYPHLVLVGIYHSHPGHTVFHSNQDRVALGKKGGVLIEPWQFSLVIDHISTNRDFPQGSGGLFFDNIQQSHFRIDTLFPDLFRNTDRSPAVVSMPDSGPQNPGHPGGGSTRSTVQNRNEQLRSVGFALTTLVWLVMIPPFGLAQIILGRGLGSAAMDRYEQRIDSLKPWLSSTLTALSVLLICMYYYLLWIFVNPLISPPSLLTLQPVIVDPGDKAQKPLFTCTFDSKTKPNLPLFVKYTLPSNGDLHTKPLIDLSTNIQAKSISSNKTLKMTIGGQVEESGEYKFQVIAHDPAGKEADLVSNEEWAKISLSLSKPEKCEWTFASSDKDENGTPLTEARRVIFHLTWKPAQAPQIKKLVVNEVVINQDGLQEDEKFLATFDAKLGVGDYSVRVDKISDPTYRRYQVEFQDDKGLAGPVVTSQNYRLRYLQTAPVKDVQNDWKNWRKELDDEWRRSRQTQDAAGSSAPNPDSQQQPDEHDRKPDKKSNKKDSKKSNKKTNKNSDNSSDKKDSKKSGNGKQLKHSDVAPDE